VDARAIPENGFDDDSRKSPSAEVTDQAGLRWLRLGGGGLLLRFQEDERRGLGLQVALLRLHHEELDFVAVAARERLGDQPRHLLMMKTCRGKMGS